MNTKVIEKSASLKDVQRDLNMIKSILIGMLGRDKEGDYNPDFVKKILKSEQKPAKYVYTGGKDLLAKLRS